MSGNLTTDVDQKCKYFILNDRPKLLSKDLMQ